MTATGLMKYDQARNALAEASTLLEVKRIEDQTTALMEYGRRANDKELELWANELRLRAERKFGELSGALEKTGPKGGRPKRSNAGTITKKQALKDAKVTPQHANRCEKLAEVPEELFEVKLAEIAERVKNPPKRKRSKKVDPETTRRMLEQNDKVNDNRVAYERGVEIRMSVFAACDEIINGRCTPAEWLNALHPAQFDSIPARVFPVIEWFNEMWRLYELRRGSQAAGQLDQKNGPGLQVVGT